MLHSDISVTAYDWVPSVAQGQVRDLRLRWALREAGFDYDVELIPQGTQGEPANLARQPFGQIPALTIDGMPMFESGACAWKIAEASKNLLPDHMAGRDACLSWVFAALNTIEVPLSMLATLGFFETAPKHFGLADGKAAAAVRPGARQLADQRLRQFDTELGGRQHIVGDRFTVADLMLTAVLLIADRLDILAPHRGAKAYFDMHTARPAYREARAEQIEPFALNAPKYQSAS